MLKVSDLLPFFLILGWASDMLREGICLQANENIGSSTALLLRIQTCGRERWSYLPDNVHSSHGQRAPSLCIFPAVNGKFIGVCWMPFSLSSKQSDCAINLSYLYMYVCVCVSVYMYILIVNGNGSYMLLIIYHLESVSNPALQLHLATTNYNFNRFWKVQYVLFTEILLHFFRWVIQLHCWILRKSFQ